MRCAQLHRVELSATPGDPNPYLLGAPAVSCLQIDGVWKISVGARRRTTDADHLKSLLFSKKI
jgi:hypothetical protein